MIKFDTTLPPTDLSQVPGIARAAEAIGFDTLWTTETQHNPFLPGPLIAEHSKTMSFGTAIAVSFARSPADLAYTAWDLSQASDGRFILGLGTQVKAHIERRFGIPWPESPVGKLREQIQAIRTLWTCWQGTGRLRFAGEYYRLNLMTPFFNPGPIDHPNIPIYIAGVNTGLARLAGELADGFLVHPFHSITYLEEVLKPAIDEGAKKAERSSSATGISATVFVITNPGEDLFVRQQLAFYASTPSYRRVMAVHGWEETAQELSGLASRGAWNEMAALITDNMVETFAVVSSPSDLGAALLSRYGGKVTRLGLYTPFVPNQQDEFWQNLAHTLRS